MYQHLMLATDLSEASRLTIDRAVALAKVFDAKLSLIHVIEHISAYAYPGYVDIESGLIEHAKAEMKALGEKLGIDQADQYVEFGSVKHQILQLAADIGVDLIVVGSHGHHGLSAILGSNASAIVNNADCDVTVIRSESD